MKYINGIFLLFTYIIFFSLSYGEMINNPILSSQISNPINYKIIYKSTEAQIESETQTLNIQEDFIKITHNSYTLFQPLIATIDENNNYYLFLEDKYYSITLNAENEINIKNFKKSFSSNYNFTDYIKCEHYNSNIPIKDNMCAIEEDEIIIYGKTEQFINFYFVTENNIYSLEFGDIDWQISCKLIKNAIFVCAYIQNNQIKLKLFMYIYLDNTNKAERGLKILGNETIGPFSNHDSVILYSTSDNKYKILCAREKSTNNIECLAIRFVIDNSSSPSTFQITIHNLTNNYEAKYSFLENNCDFIKYNSEYILCCGGTDKIICDIRDINFNLIKNFTINTPGNIKNLTFDINEEYMKLIYSNKTSEASQEVGIYEYYIYYPECYNINITINQYQTKKLDLNEFFQRKTNTQYYITFLFLQKLIIIIKIYLQTKSLH